MRKNLATETVERGLRAHCRCAAGLYNQSAREARRRRVGCIFSFVISQSITTGNFNTQFKLDGGGNVFKGSDCKAAGGVNMTQNTTNGTNSTVTVRFNAQQAGVYYIAVKFQTGNVGGDPAPAPGTTVHYDFSTTGVPGSTSSVDLVKQ